MKKELTEEELVHMYQFGTKGEKKKAKFELEKLYGIRENDKNARDISDPTGEGSNNKQ